MRATHRHCMHQSLSSGQPGKRVKTVIQEKRVKTVIQGKRVEALYFITKVFRRSYIHVLLDVFAYHAAL